MSVYAQEYGYFFNSNNSDRKYNAESFETWLKPFFVSGVFTGGLQVSAQSTPDMSVQVSAGYANLDGKLGYWNESNTLTLETASGVYSRYDTIVLRRDNTNRRVSIEVVTGTASSNPQPTAPTRTADIFELVLAEILVVAGATEITASKIEDKRPDDTVCGYVVAAVQTPDFSELYAQFTAQAEEFMGEQAAEFLAWFDEMKDQLSEDAAGHLQNEIDDINNTIGVVPVGKDLQGEIDDIEIEINTLEDGLAIVVDGDKTAHVGGAAIGDYVLVKNSTITDILDGGYKAAKAIPANTVIDKTYLTACSNGIANSLSDQIANDEKVEKCTIVACPGVTDKGSSVFRHGNILFGFVDILIGSSDLSAWTYLLKVQVGTDFPHCATAACFGAVNATDNLVENKRFSVAYTGDMANGNAIIQSGNALTKNKRYMAGPIIFGLYEGDPS